MTAGSELLIWFVGTIFVTRIFLFAYPMQSPTIRGFRVHHWMYGAVIIPIALLLSLLPLFGIGLGLFVDELPWLVMRGKDHKDNYSWWSLLGVAALTLTIFLARNLLVTPF